MASVKVYGMDGAEKGSLDLNAAVFEVEYNDVLMHDVVLAIQNARRQGNHETKTRKDVRGGGRKPFRQKGTGRARQGSSREPQMRGGGTVFGPHKRSYRQNVPQTMRRKALSCALSDRVRNEKLSVLDALVCDAPKTKPFATMMAKLSPEGRKTLVVTGDVDVNVTLSMRNLPRVILRKAADVNALDVLDANRVVVVQDALATLEERLVP